MQWVDLAAEERPKKTYPKDYHERQMTFLSNHLVGTTTGYERQQDLVDAQRKETNSWKSRHALAEAEVKMNRDCATASEEAASEAQKRLEQMTMARDQLQMYCDKETKKLEDAVELIQSLTMERDNANVERDSMRESMA